MPCLPPAVLFAVSNFLLLFHFSIVPSWNVVREIGNTFCADHE